MQKKPVVALVGFGVLFGIGLGNVSLTSGVRRYTGREVVVVNHEVAVGTFLVGALIVILFVGLLASAGSE